MFPGGGVQGPHGLDFDFDLDFDLDLDLSFLMLFAWLAAVLCSAS
jgi:hypothetical protein